MTTPQWLSEAEILLLLSDVLVETTRIDSVEVSPVMSFKDDLSLDSLSMKDIALDMEGRTGAEIPDNDLQDMRTVGDLVTYIARQTQPNL